MSHRGFILAQNENGRIFDTASVYKHIERRLKTRVTNHPSLLWSEGFGAEAWSVLKLGWSQTNHNGHSTEEWLEDLGRKIGRI